MMELKRAFLRLVGDLFALRVFPISEATNLSPLTVIPSEVTVYDPPLRALRIGTLAGDVSVVRTDGTTVVIPNWQLYEPLPMKITKVLTATTATGITGWQGDV